MAVRCTLLGHKYGDSEIEREREERGDEAVVTIREVKVCARCGNRSVVSENKEVTASAPPSDVPRPQDVGSEGADLGSEDEAPADDVDAVDPDDAEAVESEVADAAEVPPGDVPDDADESPDAEETGPEHDPETDDGVILEDDEEEPAERQHGEWPDADETHGSAEADPNAARDEAPAEWPTVDDDDDEGFDATTPTDEPAPVDDPASLDGPADDDPGTDATPADEPATAEGTPTSSDAGGHPASDVTPGRTGAVELYCPECGYTDPARDGSLREGDICPECKRGYLAAGE